MFLHIQVYICSTLCINQQNIECLALHDRCKASAKVKNKSKCELALSTSLRHGHTAGVLLKTTKF